MLIVKIDLCLVETDIFFNQLYFEKTMKIFDSNIIIHSIKDEYSYLIQYLFEPDATISEVSKLEVLGYPHLTEREKSNFEEIFKGVTILPINSTIVDKAVELKQEKKMSIGDSIIDATALLNNLELHTRNISDFKHLPLTVVNPMI